MCLFLLIFHHSREDVRTILLPPSLDGKIEVQKSHVVPRLISQHGVNMELKLGLLVLL